MTDDFQDPNVFETANAGFAQAVYEDYLKDPSTVAPEWRRLFEAGRVGEAPPPSPVPAGNGAPSPTGNGAGGPASAAPANALPIKGPAARLAANMQESLTVPTATTFREIAVRVLETERGSLNAGLKAAGRAEKLSFTHLIGYALVRSLIKHPALTQTFQLIDGAPHRVIPDGVHLGLAVDVERKDGSRGSGGAGAQARRRDDFRRVPSGLRVAGRAGPRQQADAGRLRRRHGHPHQPRRARHGGLGAAAHGGPGQRSSRWGRSAIRRNTRAWTGSACRARGRARS